MSGLMLLPRLACTALAQVTNILYSIEMHADTLPDTHTSYVHAFRARL